MKSITQRFNSLPTAKKLGLGFGFVLLILLGISVLSVRSVSALSHQYKTLLDLKSAGILLGETLRAEKDYLLKGKASYINDAVRKTERISSLLAAAKTNASHPESKQIIDKVSTQLPKYTQLLNTLKVLNGSTIASNNIEARVLQVVEELETQADDISVNLDNAISIQLDDVTTYEELERITIIIATLIALVSGMLATYVVTVSIVKPLKAAVDVAQKISDGDLSHSIQTDRQDEVGSLLRAMDRMTQNLRELIFKLSSGVTQLATSAEQMAVVSQQTSASVSQQRVETDQVATAMNEMSATVQEVAKSAEEASSAASESSHKVSQSTTILNQTLSEIKSLAQSVNQSAESVTKLEAEVTNITSILDVITNITEQTNLLALNAAIEAARSGEAGRGFSVVADEVRLLATRAKDATSEIGEVIASFQAKATHTVTEMHENASLANKVFKRTDDATLAIESINDNIKSIELMNEQIAAAAVEQSTVAEEMNQNITSIRNAAEESAAAIDETAKTSADLSALGQEQQILVRQFKLA